jgi:ABC-type multidrug transport system permease subunit
MNLMGSGLWGLGFTVVIARSRKILKRYAATPMRRSHYLLSFMLSRLGFLVFEVAAIVLFAWFVFDFTVRGSLVSMGLMTVLGALTFSGIGLLVAARPTTFEGVSGLMNLIMIPMWLLSGTFFSSERFPQVLQPFIQALPLTALNNVLRAVMNEGAALTSNWLPITVMVVWCLVSFVVALKIFKWQ